MQSDRIENQKSMKRLKYILIALILIIAAYNSVYFEPLDETKSQANPDTFDPVLYAADFWNNRLMNSLSDAVDAATLLDLFETDMQQAVSTYGNTLGIASIHAYLIKGQGRILSKNDDGVVLSVRAPDRNPDILLQTDYIYGNAIRDASGLIGVSQFSNTMDFNNISVEINKIVKEEVVPAIREMAHVGRRVHFVGASEVSEDSPDLYPLSVIPIRVEIDEQ